MNMNPMKLGSGDNNVALSSSPRRFSEDVNLTDTSKLTNDDHEAVEDKTNDNSPEQNEITAQQIDNNEMKLKDRIAQCRQIIESLKFELNEEKSKLEREGKTEHPNSSPTIPESYSSYASGYHEVSTSDNLLTDMSYSTSADIYSACVDSKLTCDENLMEYEKQLQRYQNTLIMAQTEKKNAIRKQMLTKAYRLKLLEVENQCNIELLRVKQSLQCLEPLKIIASKWKTNDDPTIDYNNFDLMPSYPQLGANSGSDVNSYKDELDMKPLTERSDDSVKNDSTSSDC